SVLLLLKKIVPTEAPYILSPFLNWPYIIILTNNTGTKNTNFRNINIDFIRTIPGGESTNIAVQLKPAIPKFFLKNRSRIVIFSPTFNCFWKNKFFRLLLKKKLFNCQ